MRESLFLATLATPEQFDILFRGEFLRGYALPRIAFVGRSNVGKSSLINALVGQTVAQTSRQPGKTRAIHFYRWPQPRWIMADLPGYGFARANGAERARWEAFIQRYLRADPQLRVLVLLLDSRQGPTPLDLDALSFFQQMGVPIQIVMSKSDQLKTQAQVFARRQELADYAQEFGGCFSQIVWTSIHDPQSLKAVCRAFQLHLDAGGLSIDLRAVNGDKRFIAQS